MSPPQTTPLDDIDHLNLSKRAHNVLSRRNIRRISQIASMTDEELLRIKQMGPAMLVELRAKIDTFHSQQLIEPLPEETSASENSIIPLKSTPIIPSHLYYVPLDTLDLSRRAYNALARKNLTTLGHVALVLHEYDTTGITSVKWLGEKSIGELKREFAAYLESDPRNARLLASGESQPHSNPHNLLLEAPYETELMIVLNRTLSEEMKQRRLSERAVVNGRPLAEWLTRTGDAQEKPGWSIADCKVLENALTTKTVCEELEIICDGIPHERLKAFVKRFGPKIRTLASIAIGFGVTRERIRQVTLRTRRRINDRLKFYPCLRIQTALAAARDMDLEITYGNWVSEITASGLLGKWNHIAEVSKSPGISPVAMLLAVCNLEESSDLTWLYGMPENLRLVIKHKTLSARLITLIRDLPKEKTRSLRRQAKNTGAVYVPWAAEQLQLSMEDARLVLSRLGYERVNGNWHMLQPATQGQSYDRLWAVFHTVLKMLRYCGPLEIKEICGGLRRHMSRGSFIVPPPSVMNDVLIAHGFNVVDRQVIWKHDNASIASASEALIMDAIARLGPVVSHLELSQSFAQANLSLAALSATLRYSPLFAKVEVGLYKLRGNVVSQEIVERARSRQPITAAEPDIAFDISGTVLFRLNLGAMAISSGVIITNHLPNLTGKWKVHGNRREYGVITIRENQVWGLTKAFRALSVEVGQRVELRFNTWDRVVTVAKVNNGRK